jgi:hypothetical protein
MSCLKAAAACRAWMPYRAALPTTNAGLHTDECRLAQERYGIGTAATSPGQRMVWQLLVAWCPMAASVAIHAYGLTWALQRLRRRVIPSKQLETARLFIALAGWIVLLHVVEITAWAFTYTLMKAMPDLQSALYFSAVTYTTTGYGDLVLPFRWRLVGAVEALTGILMCGWSTGFFFAVVSRLFAWEDKPAMPKPAMPKSTMPKHE